eukprot:bmy_04655T0
MTLKSAWFPMTTTARAARGGFSQVLCRCMRVEMLKLNTNMDFTFNKITGWFIAFVNMQRNPVAFRCLSPNTASIQGTSKFSGGKCLTRSVNRFDLSLLENIFHFHGSLKEAQ